MKKLAVIAAASMLAISGAAFAADQGTGGTATKPANYNDNGKNCFGQDRAADARQDTTVLSAGGYSNEGQILSTRGGDNASANATYKEQCQNQPPS